MNSDLSKMKQDFKKIKQFIDGRPMPSQVDLTVFLNENNLQQYSKFAEHYLIARHEFEFLCFTKKINKHR